MIYDNYFPGGSIGPVRSNNPAALYDQFVQELKSRSASLQAPGGAVPTTAAMSTPQAYVMFTDKGDAQFVFDPKKASEAAENALERALEDVLLSMRKKDIISLDARELDTIISEIKAAVVLAAKEAHE